MTVRIGDVPLMGRRRHQEEGVPLDRAHAVALTLARRRRHSWWYQMGFGAPKPR